MEDKGEASGKPIKGNDGVFMLHEISLKGVTKINGADYSPVPAAEKYQKPAGAVRIMTYDIMNNPTAASVISEIKPDFAGIQSVDDLDAVASAAGLSAKYSDNAGHAVLAGSLVETKILKKDGSFEAALMETEKCIIISTSFQARETSEDNQAQVSELSKALVAEYRVNPQKPVFLMCDCGDPFGYNFANIYWLKLWGWRPLNQLYATTYTGTMGPHEAGMNCIDCVFVWEYWSYDGTSGNGMPEYIDYRNLFTFHADYKYPVEGTDVHYPVFVDITFK